MGVLSQVSLENGVQRVVRLLSVPVGQKTTHGTREGKGWGEVSALRTGGQGSRLALIAFKKIFRHQILDYCPFCV